MAFQGGLAGWLVRILARRREEEKFLGMVG